MASVSLIEQMQHITWLHSRSSLYYCKLHCEVFSWIDFLLEYKHSFIKSIQQWKKVASSKAMNYVHLYFLCIFMYLFIYLFIFAVVICSLFDKLWVHQYTSKHHINSPLSHLILFLCETIWKNILYCVFYVCKLRTLCLHSRADFFR